MTWLAPAANGGSAVTGYTVTASPGGASCSTSGTLTCAVTGLSNGTAYTFTVKASNVAGSGPASTASAAVTPHADYVSVVPERLLDTRAAQIGYSGVKPVAEQTVELKVTGVGTANVPADAEAVVINITGVDATAAGHVTIYPCGTSRPSASNLNLTLGQTAPNLVIVKVGTGGKVCVYTKAGSHLIADITGYHE